MKLKQFIEERMGKTMLIIEHTTNKILKKELKRLKKDIIKGILNG